MGDSHEDTSATVPEAVAEEVSLFSTTDIVLFSLIVGVLTYWFIFKKKKEEIPEFSKIQTTAPPVKESSFVEKMKKTGRNIIVFYGSQTGTAEEFANRLSKDAHRYGMRGMSADPVIMVGPGTGVAPFMGFIQERAWLREQGKEVGETLLYYGCRRSDEDYLYREELARFHKDGALTQLNVAFSREQAHKVYVQHLLKRDKEHLWKLIHEGGAHIYVCGDARNMAKDVQNTFYDIVAEFDALLGP